RARGRQGGLRRRRHDAAGGGGRARVGCGAVGSLSEPRRLLPDGGGPRVSEGHAPAYDGATGGGPATDALLVRLAAATAALRRRRRRLQLPLERVEQQQQAPVVPVGAAVLDG